MSGLEVVGLVLAILPLLVSAAEHYDDCIRPILRYRKLVIEVQIFQRKLEVQKAIFINQCRILLESVVEHDDAVRMLASRSNDPCWQNSSLEKQLLEQLGDSTEACVTSIELIREKLQVIRKESQSLQDVVDLDKDVKQRLMKKVRACLSKSPLDKYIKALRNLNDDFIKLSNQVSFASNPVTKSHQHVSAKLNSKGISRYKMGREASAKVYEALVRACTKHSEHLALFRIEPIYDSAEATDSNQIKFRIAFSRAPLLGLANNTNISELDEPIWFMIDTVVHEATGIYSVKQNDGKYVSQRCSHIDYTFAFTLQHQILTALKASTISK